MISITVNYVKFLQGRLAQLDRVLASEARCREFESHIAHQKFQVAMNLFLATFSFQARQ